MPRSEVAAAARGENDFGQLRLPGMRRHKEDSQRPPPLLPQEFPAVGVQGSRTGDVL